MTELTILTADDPGLFSRIAGAVAAAGANIAGARITTCHDGTVLDVFFLHQLNSFFPKLGLPLLIFEASGIQPQ
ncbi:MAG: ACT domain-containing protein [SAR324 cluster bacterium]|nr:ACT domain-containing protein [SAR324 cluster bacterium]